MIDGMSFGIDSIEFAKDLLIHPSIKFAERKTKGQNKIHEGFYKNMKFEVFEPSLKIKVTGSIHKFFNNGEHNWNDFDRLSLYDTLHDFCQEFDIDPAKSRIHSLEFGVNVNVPFDPSYFIKRVLNYKFAKIEQLIHKGELKDGITIKFAQFKLKIYNKSKQYGLSYNLLRFEIKILKMQKLGSIRKVMFLTDLMNAEILRELGIVLLEEFDKLIIFEPLDTRKMTEKEGLAFQRMSNRIFWYSIDRAGVRRESVTKYRRLVEKYDGKLQSKVSSLISLKWQDLLLWNSIGISQKDHIFLPGVRSMKNDVTDHSSRDLNCKKPTLFYQDDYEALFENNVSKARSLKCPNCKKIIKHNDGKYCNSRCKELLQKRDSLKNTRKKITHIYEYLQLFDQSDFIKIDPKIRQLLFKDRCL